MHVRLVSTVRRQSFFLCMLFHTYGNQLPIAMHEVINLTLLYLANIHKGWTVLPTFKTSNIYFKNTIQFFNVYNFVEFLTSFIFNKLFTFLFITASTLS